MANEVIDFYILALVFIAVSFVFTKLLKRFAKADTFFIDPNKDNLRATHVYEKAGFKLIGSFAAEQGFFIGKESFLMIKKL